MKFIGDFLSSSVGLTIAGVLVIPLALKALLMLLTGYVWLFDSFLWLFGRVPG